MLEGLKEIILKIWDSQEWINRNIERNATSQESDAIVRIELLAQSLPDGKRISYWQKAEEKIEGTNRRRFPQPSFTLKVGSKYHYNPCDPGYIIITDFLKKYPQYKTKSSEKARRFYYL